MPNKASLYGLKSIAVVMIHELIYCKSGPQGGTKLIQSPHTPSLSWLSVMLRGGVAFCKRERQVVFSRLCVEDSSLCSSARMMECPGLLSKGRYGSISLSEL